MAAKHNLTGGQIQEVLDFFIYESLRPLLKSSDIFDIQLMYLLTNTACNKKRKLSALPREQFFTTACNALITTDPDRKHELVSQAKIERSFVYNFIVNFLKAVESYKDVYVEFLTSSDFQKRKYFDRQLAVIEKSVSIPRSHLFPLINICTEHLEHMYRFRNRIVGQYLRHAYKQAISFCKQKGENFDFEDVYQNLLAAITKAVDKYDSSKGAITSYINFWILNAQTYSNSNHGHEYGIAYTIPQMQKKQIAGNGASPVQVNFSVSLDKLVGPSGSEEQGELHDFVIGSEGVDKEIESKDALNTMLYLAKKADKTGIGRLYLDLDEFFSNRELERMRSTMIRQRIKV